MPASDISPADLGLPAAKFTSFRKGQFPTVLHILESDRRFSLLSAPTGSGKSLINVATGILLGGRTLILTGTKALQEQLLRDFSKAGMVDIRGHANYRCAEGERTRFEPVCAWPGDACEYKAQVARAKDAPLVVTNYAYWVSLGRYSDPALLGEFDLLVLDEGHTAADWLTSLLTVTLYKAEIQSLLGLDLPRISPGPAATRKAQDPPGSTSVIEQWAPWARDAHRTAQEEYARVKATPAATSPDRTRLLAQLTGIGRDLATLAQVPEDAEEFGVEWIAMEMPRGRGLKFSPVWPAPYAERYLFRGAEQVVLSSATLPRGLGRYLGIEDGERAYIEVPSSFSPDRRPLIWIPTTRVDRRTFAHKGHIRQWVNRIDQIVGEYQGYKGVIHTRSYGRAKDLIAESKYASIMLIHDSRNSQRVIGQFKRADAPCVLVSPSVEEGVDFYGDECRWQILAKVPFLDSRDPITKKRMAQDKNYGNLVTSIAIIQQVGRGMRSEEDWCVSFIIDDHWAWFRKAGDFPKWFRQGWRIEDQVPALADLLPEIVAA